MVDMPKCAWMQETEVVEADKTNENEMRILRLYMTPSDVQYYIVNEQQIFQTCRTLLVVHVQRNF